MGQAADGGGAAAVVRDVFDHPAFATLKTRGAAFLAVRPQTRELLWANAAATAFWDRSPQRISTALFGPPGGGWLGSVATAVVPGRDPQMFRTGVGAGLGMRGALILARATLGPDGVATVGFAIPDSGRDGAREDEWAQQAGPAVGDASAPDISIPLSEAVPPPAQVGPRDDDDAGTSLARRSQIAVLRDRLIAATDGAATLRFLWRTDAGAVLTQIDQTLSTRLGAPLSSGSEPFAEAVARFDTAAGKRLGDAFAARTTWSGIAFPLPVAGGAAVVPTMLSGSPMFGRDRTFEGFRGFGIVDLGGLEAKARAEAETLAPAAPSAAETAEPGEADSLPLPLGPGAPQASEAPPFSEPSRRDERPSPTDGSEPATMGSEVGRATFANVVDLRSFQAVRSGAPVHETFLPEPVRETGVASSELDRTSALDADAGPPDSVPPEAPISDEMAFLALGAALRAQIGELGTVEAGSDAASATPDAVHPEPSSLPPVTAAADRRETGPDTEPLGTIASPAAASPAAALPAAALPPVVPPLLDHLPVAILVLKGGEPAYANPAAALMLAFDTPGDLVAVGPRLSAEPTTAGLTLKNGRGDEVAVPGEPLAVAWDGAAATLWTLTASRTETPAQLDGAPAITRPEGEERTIDLIDRVDDAVALLDGDGRIRRLNERGRSWFEAVPLGEAVTALLAPESRPAALQLLDEARMRRDGSPASPPHREVLARTTDSPAAPMLLTVGRLGAAGFYATLRDVSALRRAERDEARSRGERERDAGRLPDLLARVSHEIRTPLNAILGFAEVMMDERFGPLGSPRYRDYLKDIHDSGTQVVALVGDLLDLSRIEAGRIELAVGAVDVNKIVTEIVAQMQPEAHRGRVIVRTSLASRIPSAMADERSTRQIVQHLLSNAVKFNEPGGQVIVSTAQDDGGAVLLRIRDTGVGMTEAEIAAALEPFHDVSPPRPANGNGLGLPLARALVGANGASLSIRSRPREGTLVEVSFPPAPAEDARRPA